METQKHLLMRTGAITVNQEPHLGEITIYSEKEEPGQTYRQPNAWRRHPGD